jgi:GNAT superfamily N-acetyltransferase
MVQTPAAETAGARPAEIIPITDDLARNAAHLSAAAALHRSLRANLPADYEAYMRRMFAEGAEMAVLVVDGAVRSLAVYRSHHTTFHGLRFYVDDLVTDEAERGRGFGGQMLAWCETRARERGCDAFDLESGVQRPRTHRFYFRQGLTIFAFSFTKSLR